MPQADNDGVSIHYETTGPGGGDAEDGADAGDTAETVVLVEGLGYGRWMWRWQRDRLADEGYRVVVWDNRGTGDSDAPEGPYTVEQMASDLGKRAVGDIPRFESVAYGRITRLK